MVSINSKSPHDHPSRDAGSLASGRLSQLLALEVAIIGRAAADRRKRDDRSRQRILVSPDDRGVSLCPAVLADDPAGMAFGETVFLSNAFYRLPAPLGAYKFPEATSLSTCFSSDRSATRRLRRTFSRSRSFIRYA
jgi:hypothetical protein